MAPQGGRSANRLRRYPAYRAMLEAHLSRQRGAASLVGDGDRDLNVLRGKLRAAQFESSNLIRDRARLTALVNKHLPGIQGHGPFTPRRIEAAPFAGGAVFDDRKAFGATAQILATLLGRLGEFGYEVDYERCRIFDRSARPVQEEVADANSTRWFIEWLKSRS